jgi:hypothetical protein
MDIRNTIGIPPCIKYIEQRLKLVGHFVRMQNDLPTAQD